MNSFVNCPVQAKNNWCLPVTWPPHIGHKPSSYPSFPWASRMAAQLAQEQTWPHGRKRVSLGLTRQTTHGAAAAAGALSCSSSCATLAPLALGQVQQFVVILQLQLQRKPLRQSCHLADVQIMIRVHQNHQQRRHHLLLLLLMMMMMMMVTQTFRKIPLQSPKNQKPKRLCRNQKTQSSPPLYSNTAVSFRHSLKS